MSDAFAFNVAALFNRLNIVYFNPSSQVFLGIMDKHFFLGKFHYSFQHFAAGTHCAHRKPALTNCNKSCLLFSSAEMFKKPIWQTVWTQMRLLL